MIRKDEIKLVTLLLLVAGYFTIKYFKDKSEINRNRKYVIGYLRMKQFGGSENGWVYTYEYQYGDIKYSRSFSGPLPESISTDSLIFLRISSKNPQLSRQILNIKVPNCFRIISMPKYGWNELPKCKDG